MDIYIYSWKRLKEIQSTILIELDLANKVKLNDFFSFCRKTEDISSENGEKIYPNCQNQGLKFLPCYQEVQLDQPRELNVDFIHRRYFKLNFSRKMWSNRMHTWNLTYLESYRYAEWKLNPAVCIKILFTLKALYKLNVDEILQYAFKTWLTLKALGKLDVDKTQQYVLKYYLPRKL